MLNDLRFALRMINTHRWFSAAIVATLALGIGLNTMVFTLVNAVLFKPIAVAGGDRLVMVRQEKPNQQNSRTGVSLPDFREYRVQASSFEALEAGMGDDAVIAEKGNPPQTFNMFVLSSGLFETMRVLPVMGRGFVASDDQAGATPVVLLGYGVWKDRYGSADVVGRVVRVNGKAATIVGVMPEGFKFPQDSDLWMPLVPTPDLEKRTQRDLELFGFLKPGVSIEQSRAEMEAIAARLRTAYPEANRDLHPLVQTFQDRYNGGPIRLVFFMMQTAVGFVLLIACANVANMMLSRALTRQREISIRAAMGASRWRIVRQLLIESMMLSVLGGVLGLSLSYWGVRAFDLAVRDTGKPYWIVFTMNYTVFGYFAALCIATGLLFGLAPALRSSRVDLNSTLKEGSRSAGTQRGGRLSSVLVVLQFGLTMVLLTGAAIFVRAIQETQSLNKWMPSDQLLGARVSLPADRYADAEARRRFFEQLMPRLKAIPGVQQVSFSGNAPGLGAGSRSIEIEDAPLADPKHGPSAIRMVVSPGYFSTIDLPIVVGRDFNDMDGMTGRRAAIVTQQFAERHWPRQVALGKRFRFYENDKPGEWMSVVGVSANMVQRPNEAVSDPLMFVPYRQEGWDSMMLLLRSGSASTLTSSLRAAVQSLDQDMPLTNVGTLTSQRDRQLWMVRVFGTVFSSFAFIALVIAAVGIYAVIAQSTARRTQEIGVRMALGATSFKIMTMVLSRGLIQLGAGLALGLAVALPLPRVMHGLPLRMSGRDPMLFAAVCGLLTLVGVFASWLPAQRASALEPVSALRDE